MNTEKSPRDYYALEGYYVFRNLIPSDKIDALLKLYKGEILSSKEHFFRQSSNRWEKNRINQHGYSQESFRDVHFYPGHRAFSDAALEIFCSNEVQKALAELTDGPGFNLVQSMLFDQNTGTAGHQDSYYLDSLPNGNLLAGWFALEDIHEEAGRFWVMPGTHKIDFDLNEEEKTSNGAYLKKLATYINANKEKVTAPALNKGDVLFWNSWTVHGSAPTINPIRSRKSLTAHYLPSRFEFGSRHHQTPMHVDYGNFQGMKFRKVPDVHSVYTLKNKLYTDAMQYLWYRPRLRKIVKGAWQVKKFFDPRSK